MTPAPVIRLHPDDGVLIARSSLPPGLVVADGVATVDRIPAGHKVAIKPIAVSSLREYKPVDVILGLSMVHAVAGTVCANFAGARGWWHGWTDGLN